MSQEGRLERSWPGSAWLRGCSPREGMELLIAPFVLLGEVLEGELCLLGLVGLVLV